MFKTSEIDVDDKRYPEVLKEEFKKLIPSLAPKKLYYKGVWDNHIFENCLAVVGSRHLTNYGRQATQQIVTELASAGITIVSGFMYGGDEAAHSACVKCGGRTIACMPCGIDLIHPPQHKDLYKNILENNGLLISEYEGTTLPQQFTYIQRNRIVAGLSKAILVTEASLNSGSLITASYAKKFGKKIFALPGQITSDVAKGTLKLIKEGAEPVADAQDILKFFKVLVAQKKTSRDPGSTQDCRTSGVLQSGSLEDKILDQLSRESMKADDMARMFCIPVSQIGTTLSLMQLKGLINLDSNKYYLN